MRSLVSDFGLCAGHRPFKGNETGRTLVRVLTINEKGKALQKDQRVSAGRQVSIALAVSMIGLLVLMNAVVIVAALRDFG